MILSRGSTSNETLDWELVKTRSREGGEALSDCGPFARFVGHDTRARRRRHSLDGLKRAHVLIVRVALYSLPFVRQEAQGIVAARLPRQEVACRLGAVSNGAVDHGGFRSSSRRDLPYALGKHPLGQRAHLQPAWQVPKILVLRPANPARQGSTLVSQARRERRMGLSLEANPVRLDH